MPPTRKYDRSFRGEDHFEIQFDTNLDKRTGYAYYVSPLGTRQDSSRNDYGITDAWDASWQCKATIHDDYWLAEFMIPIENMHFLAQDKQTWGINFHRGYHGREVRSHWHYSKSDSFEPKNFGILTGLKLKETKVSPSPKLEYYASSRFGIDETDNDFASGGDVTVRLGPQFVSTFTMNPDFGQVEADEDSISLRDTERIFSEKRPFFKEGAELFKTPINLYYSRRITDIAGGAKITGAGKTWHAGLLTIDGEITRPRTEGVTTVPGVYTIARTTHDLTEDNRAGHNVY